MPTAECPLCKASSTECNTREEALNCIPHNNGCKSNLADPNYLGTVKYSGRKEKVKEANIEVEESDKPPKKKDKGK